MAWTRRAFVLGGVAGAAVGAAGAGALGPALPTLAGAAVEAAPPPAAGLLNDASLLSPTPVRRHLVTTQAPGEEGLTAALRDALAQARADGRPLCVGAARHSMGGHAIPRDGHAVTFAGDLRVEPDAGAGLARVHGGARWRDVIAALDPLGLSPLVMQSNHDFGVAATFSVNAHGWPTAHPPMGSTVRSVRMMLADGTLVIASREENADLFRAAMGGYGLLGVITELDLEVVPNALLAPTFATMPADALPEAFAAASRAHPMAYGRLNVDRARLFADALLVTYAPAEGEVPPAQGSGWLSRASRTVFRAQLGNEWVKRRRWWVETGLGPRLAGPASRNSLLNEPVATLDDRDRTRTDILHEYFVDPAALPAFLAAARRIIPASYQELLNVTLRWVERDAESTLAYAPDGPRIAAVMLFSQEMTARAEADMARMTRALIDAALDVGGSYYLPYRPHATLDQFRRAYPRWEEMADLKRRADPDLLFRNGFWDAYLGAA